MGVTELVFELLGFKAKIKGVFGRLCHGCGNRLSKKKKKNEHNVFNNI